MAQYLSNFKQALNFLFPVGQVIHCDIFFRHWQLCRGTLPSNKSYRIRAPKIFYSKKAESKKGHARKTRVHFFSLFFCLLSSVCFFTTIITHRVFALFFYSRAYTHTHFSPWSLFIFSFLQDSFVSDHQGPLLLWSRLTLNNHHLFLRTEEKEPVVDYLLNVCTSSTCQPLLTYNTTGKKWLDDKYHTSFEKKERRYWHLFLKRQEKKHAVFPPEEETSLKQALPRGGVEVVSHPSTLLSSDWQDY